MKKLLILCASVMLILPISCTENARVRKFGGKTTYNLNPNEELIQLDWKGDNLWILTSEADPHFFKPRTYSFKEKSNFGVIEGEIIIKEFALTDSI